MTKNITRLDFLKIAGLGSAELAAAPLKRFVTPYSRHLPFYVGTYTAGKSKGIYLCSLDTTTGQIKQSKVTGGIENPSFLTMDSTHHYLYAVSETEHYEGMASGSVYAYRINPDTKSLEFINKRPSHGTDPCYITVDHKNRFVLVANYTSGSVAIFPIRPDGGLGELTFLDQHHGSSVNPERQEGPHAHCIILDPSNRHALAADLGLDKILINLFDNQNGSLKPAPIPFVSVKPGAGPRHIKFSPDGTKVYLICEMGNLMMVFDYDPGIGKLTQIQTISTLPAGYSGSDTAAEVQISSNGLFVYGSNRGDDSIVVYSVDPVSGKLTDIQHQSTMGKTPRHFMLDPTGTFLLAANKDSDNIVVFSVNTQTGMITPTGQIFNVPSPVCIKFV